LNRFARRGPATASMLESDGPRPHRPRLSDRLQFPPRSARRLFLGPASSGYITMILDRIDPKS
jgi:hypothetical protein